MKAIYKWEEETFPSHRRGAGRIKRLRAKAIVYIASRHFKVPRPLVIGGRWYEWHADPEIKVVRDALSTWEMEAK